MISWRDTVTFIMNLVKEKTKVAFMENHLQDCVFLKPLFQVRTPLGWWIEP